MALSASAKLWSITLAVVLVAIGVIVYGYFALDTSNQVNETNSTSASRQAYSDLYDAAWRADEKNDSVLMTATLVTPALKKALGEASERSSSEEQIYGILQDVPTSAVSLIVTFDSLEGAIPDAVVLEKLHLTSNPVTPFSKPVWESVIAPSRIVNTPAGASSQIGVLTFSTEQAVDWNALNEIKLEANGIGDLASRTLTWTRAVWEPTNP